MTSTQKFYKGALAGLLIWPAVVIVLLTQLDPSEIHFPFLLKIAFLCIALFSFSLNYVVDYHRDNKRWIQLIIRFNGLIPFLVLLPFYPEELVLETPLVVWLGFLVASYLTILNHFGVFSKSEKRIWERIGIAVSLLSLGLGIGSILQGNNLLFSAWMWTILACFLLAVALLFSKANPSNS
jgi:hypothetical protein